MTHRNTRTRFLLATILVWGVGLASQAQDPAANLAPQLPPTVSADAAAQLPTVADLSAQRQAVTQDANLAPEIRAQLEVHYVKAIEYLQAAEQANQQTTALRQELDSAPQRVSELETQLASKTAEKEPSAPPTDEVVDPEALSAYKQKADETAAALTAQAQQIATEIERRAARRPQLAELRTEIEKQLEQLPAQLVAPAPNGEPPEVTEIRLVRLRCRQYRLNSELALLEQESRTYEGTTRLWTLQHDLIALEVREAEKVAQQWQQRLSDARRKQAEREAADAQRALAMSDESVRSEAEKNSELAEVNTKLTEFLHTTQVDLDQVIKSLGERQEEFKSLKERAEAAEFSPAVGVLLRNRRSTLPARHTMRLRIEARQDDISTLNWQLIEWQAERKTLVDLPTATETIIDKLATPPKNISVADLREQVAKILETRLNLLGQLLENGRSKLDLLVRLDSEEKQLLALVDHEAQWLAEKVLWVRSTGIIGTQMSLFTDSLRILTTPGRWHNVMLTVVSDFKSGPWLWLAFVLLLACLPIVRFRLKRRINELGAVAERATCVTIRPTAKTLLYTVLIAVPFPAIIWCVGWRLAFIAKGESTLQALGVALQMVAGVWAVIAMIRQVARPCGLGDAHFEWAEGSLSTVRGTMRLMEFALLPTLAALAFTALLGDDEIAATLGRVAFLGTIACLGIAIFRLVWPSSPIMLDLEQQHTASWLWRTRWIWMSLLLISPFVLAGLSLSGYHYTAVQLTGRVAATLFCVLTVLLITSLLSRWLLVTYRNLAIRRGRERRQQLLQAAQADPDQPIPQDTTPELRLADINVQSRRLLRLAGGVSLLVALYAIWIDVLPALGVLGRITVGWDNGIKGLSIDGLPQPVTLADLVLAVVIGMLTIFASRNLPGLMQIALLQRLPMDAGSRYAASTVSRYLIVVTGIIFGFRAVGIGWSSVQWLVAAMTVGLGFGLQEIFANFVSGIILLFERPVRVGDTVTIGDITGTVTRIQIRATTIVDWDNKELIVPNREFVTGNLVNWTLTNPTLRLTVTVGIAYGSDTRLATRLLYEVAKNNSHVLDDPEPVVVFSEFGDSTLNFELRLFVNGLMSYRRQRHDLNMAIDDLFREHNIEIAFPQRDLHVRSVQSDQLRQALKPS